MSHETRPKKFEIHKTYPSQAKEDAEYFGVKIQALIDETVFNSTPNR